MYVFPSIVIPARYPCADTNGTASNDMLKKVSNAIGVFNIAVDSTAICQEWPTGSSRHSEGRGNGIVDVCHRVAGYIKSKNRIIVRTMRVPALRDRMPSFS